MAVYYVSPSGNDAWSGTSANGNGTSGPFATLGRAQQAVEANSGSNTVYLEGGTYTLLAPLGLTSADSNTSFLAYQGQQPLISGGAPVSDWTVATNGVWTAHVALSEVDQLTVNGVAQQQARAPNYDPVNPVEGGWAWARPLPSGYDAYSSLAFDKGVFSASQLAAGERVVVITADGYTARVMTIASVNYSDGVMSFNEQTNSGIGLGARFFVEGAKSLLRAFNPVGFITTPARLLHCRSRGESRDSNDGRHPRAYRSAPLFVRRGRAAPSPCSSASAASCSCVWQ